MSETWNPVGAAVLQADDEPPETSEGDESESERTKALGPRAVKVPKSDVDKKHQP
jgi:hypothetical protein